MCINKQDDEQDDEYKLFWWVGGGIVSWIILCYLFTLDLPKSDSNPKLSIFSTLFIIGLGSSVIGAFFGFIFGIPKTLQSNQTIQSSAQNSRFIHNTNFEEISDWLTKIIVGLSIAEMGNVKTTIWQLSEEISSSMMSSQNSRPDLKILDPQIFILFLLIYSSILGFFAGYFASRFVLRRALINFDASAETLKELQQKVGAQDLDRNAWAISLKKLDSSKEISVSQKELTEALKQASPEMRDQILLHAKASLESAITDIKRKKLIPLTQDIFRALIDVDTDKKHHIPYAQLAIAISKSANVDNQEIKKLLMSAIEIRDKNQENGWRDYELFLSETLIQLDQNDPNISLTLKKYLEYSASQDEKRVYLDKLLRSDILKQWVSTLSDEKKKEIGI